MQKQKSISIFGVTGSVGRSTWDLVGSSPDQFDVRAVSAGTDCDSLTRAAIDLGAEYAVIADESRLNDLRQNLSGTDIKCLCGNEGLLHAASLNVDCVMAAISGFAGLPVIMQAIESCKTLAIANKEPLVAAGRFVIDKARDHGTAILPVDSEHNAIFQVFETANKDAIDSIILTASGGPFLNTSIDRLEFITPEMAVKHPNWSMGAKISVDSATLMNKGLEVIEAAHLFDMKAEEIDVCIHPQSIIHSMVAYNDGSILAQMGAPDMRTPIAYALAWPKRMPTTGQKLDWKSLKNLSFEKPDTHKFPLLQDAYAALRQGQESCVILNAANEVAVNAFLAKKIDFLSISRLISRALEKEYGISVETLDDIYNLDKSVRECVNCFIVHKR